MLSIEPQVFSKSMPIRDELLHPTRGEGFALPQHPDPGRRNQTCMAVTGSFPRGWDGGFWPSEVVEGVLPPFVLANQAGKLFWQ